MMTRDYMDRMITAIQALGYTREQAQGWAPLIGDTPEMTEAGETVVRDRTTGEELVRLALDW